MRSLPEPPERELANHWRNRRLRAFDNTRSARTGRELQIYLRLAEQYRSLERWCARFA
jgi:hypothetical protein